MDVIGGKWKSCIIFELRNGAKQPGELHKLFPEANARVINQQLKELEAHGIIQKKIFAELPPHSEYSLTSVGRTLLPVLEQLEKWATVCFWVVRKKGQSSPESLIRTGLTRSTKFRVAGVARAT